LCVNDVKKELLQYTTFEEELTASTAINSWLTT